MQDVEMTFTEWEVYKKGGFPKRVASEHGFSSRVEITAALFEGRVVVGSTRLTTNGTE